MEELVQGLSPGSSSNNIQTLLKQVYLLHSQVVQGLKVEVEEWQSKSMKWQQEEAMAAGKENANQEKYEAVLAENGHLKAQIADLNKRLSAPCLPCGLLEKQVHQQEILLTTYQKMLAKTQQTVTLLGALKINIDRYEGTKEIIEMKIKNLQRRRKRGESKQALTESEFTEFSDQESQLSSVDDQPRDVGNQDVKKTTRHESENVEGAAAAEEGVSPGGTKSEEEVSPGGTKSKLRLGRVGKRARCRYREEAVQEHKKTRQELQTEICRSPPKPSMQQGKCRAGTLVPETCDVNLSILQACHQQQPLMGIKTRSQRELQGRPNLIIPETVPLMFDEIWDHSLEDSAQQTFLGKENDEIQLTKQKISQKLQESVKKVKKVLASSSECDLVPGKNKESIGTFRQPPSDSSTPLRSSARGHHGDKSSKEHVISPILESHTPLPKDKHPDKDTSSKTHTDIEVKGAQKISSMASAFGPSDSQPSVGEGDRDVIDISSVDSCDERLVEPGSPVFARAAGSRGHMRDHHMHSPTLFDDQEEEQHEEGTGKPKVSATGLHGRLQLEAVSSPAGVNVSNPSPSMLTGRVQSKVGDLLPESAHITEEGEDTKDVWMSKKKQLDSSTQNSQRCLRPRPSGKTSPVGKTSGRVSAGSSKRLGVLTFSPTVKPSKKLVQAKLSADLFQPTKHNLAQSSDFKGGRYGEISMDAQEQKDYEEAIKRSLHCSPQKSRYDTLANTTISDPGVPLISSTPCPIAPGPLSPSQEPFKVPLSPRKLPSTPKHTKQPRSAGGSRRSPRFKGGSSLETTDDNMQELPDLATPPSAHSHHKQKSKLDISVVRNLNGSIDPGVSLSQYETHPAGALTGDEPEFLEAVSVLDLEVQEYQNDDADIGDRTQKHTAQSLATFRNPDKFSRRAQANPSQSRDERAPSLEMSSQFQDTLASEPTMDDTILSGTSVVFGKKRGDQKMTRKKIDVSFESFDRVPEEAVPKFAYVDVVRKQSERQQLATFTCHECEEYYSGRDMTTEEKQEIMKNCRHRARYVPPGTPEHYWSVPFPDTQQCQERGYLNTTQARPSAFRRKRRLQQL